MIATNENLTEIFRSLSLKGLVSRVVRTVREAAEEIPAFRNSHNGCIRLTFVPLCLEADNWLGGLSECDENGKIIDVNEYEFVRKIYPDGSHTIQWVDPEDGHIELVNCYAYSALKTAYLSRLCRNGLTRSSDPEAEAGYLVEENGWSTEKGATVTTVCYEDTELFRMYVCVSGAESEEDDQCSTSGMAKGQEVMTAIHDDVNCTIGAFYV